MPEPKPRPEYVKPMTVCSAEILTFARPATPDTLFIRREAIDYLVEHDGYTVRWYYIGSRGERPIAEPIGGNGPRFTARSERDEWWEVLQ